MPAVSSWRFLDFVQVPGRMVTSIHRPPRNLQGITSFIWRPLRSNKIHLMTSNKLQHPSRDYH